MFCQHFIKRISSCCHLYIVLCHFNIVKALLFTIQFHARLRKVGANGWTVYRELIQTEENILEQNISSLMRLFCSTTQKINVCLNQRLAQTGPFLDLGLLCMWSLWCQHKMQVTWQGSRERRATS